MPTAVANLLEIINHPGLKLVAATRGGEYHGSCPMCGGTDRFRCQPAQGQWHCRGCSPTSHWQDAVDFVMMRDKVSMKEAQEKLGLTLGAKRVGMAGPTPELQHPGPAWQQAAIDAVDDCGVALLQEEGKMHRSWLKHRGISDATMLTARLGMATAGETWSARIYDKTERVTLQEDGVLLPLFGIDGNLWGLKIATGRKDMKYCLVKGSMGGLATVGCADGEKDFLFITEGEMDMLVAHTKIGHLCDVATFGAITSKEKVALWEPYLAHYKRIFLCTDEDDVGIKGNRAFGELPTAALRPPVGAFQGKDLTDWVKAGWNVCAAVEAAIEQEKHKTVAGKPFNAYEPGPLDFPYTLIESVEGVEEMIDALAFEKELACDTETTGLDPLHDTLLLFQVGARGHTFMIDMQQVPPVTLKPFLEAHNFIFQNAKFDLKFLYRNCGVWAAVAADTYLNEEVLRAGLPKVQGASSLAGLTYKYTGQTLSKEERMTFIGHKGPFTDEQLRYAGRDVQALYPILDRQREELAAQKLTRVAALENLLVTAVADMELCGILVDQAKWRSFIGAAQAKKDELQPQICEMLGTVKPNGQNAMWSEFSWNINSNKQLVDGLVALGIDLGKPEEGKAAVSLDDTHLKKIEDKHPIIPALLQYREAQKLVSSFGDSILNQIRDDSRIHADFGQLNTDTGRFSCRTPNLQQIPQTSDLRSCFVPAPGNVFVIADYSQIELRILAHYSKDKAMMQAFIDGHDLHTATAATMFGLPIDDVPKQKRFEAKSINFGLVYGRGPAALADQLKVSEAKAKELVKTYFDAYPGVNKWLRVQGARACREGKTYTLLGRRRLLNMPVAGSETFRRDMGSVRRQGTNSPIQGSSGDMTKMAMAMLFHRYTRKGMPMRTVLCVHDEIVLEAREDFAEEAKGYLETEMIAAAQGLIPSVPVVVEAKIATCWSK